MPDNSIVQIIPPNIDIDNQDINVFVDNRDLHDTNSNQLLKHDDINRLKEENLFHQGGREIVNKLVENSITFEDKTQYAQVKYIKRKEKKYMKWCRVTLPSASSLLLSWNKKRESSYKLNDLRIDSWSLITKLAGIHSDSRVLIWDEITKGFAIGAILELSGSVLAIYNEKQIQLANLCYFNLGDKSKFHSLKFDEMEMNNNDHQVIDNNNNNNGNNNDNNGNNNDNNGNTNQMNPPHTNQENNSERIKMKKAKRDAAKAFLSSPNGFSSLIIFPSNEYDSKNLEKIKKMASFLRPSSRIIFYSSFKELLMPIFKFLREDRNWVDVRLLEPWLRPYQTSLGRLHPEMTISSHGGFILSAIKVINDIV